MTPTRFAPPRRRVVILQAIGVLATLTVFVIDIVMPHGYDFAYLYAVTVLVAAFSTRREVVIRTAIGAVGLTFAAFALKEHGHTHGVVATEIFSRAMASVVIALIAVVAIAVIQRDLKNYELGKALSAAEGERESDKRMLAAAGEIAAIGTWSLSADEGRFDWSEEVAAMHGLEPDIRPALDDILALVSTADSLRMQSALSLAWEKGIPFREELLLALPDGTQRWIVIMGDGADRDRESTTRLHGTVQDISHWKQAEFSESAERNRFSQLTASLPIVVWTADPQGHVDYFNEALPIYTGLTHEELENDGWVSTVDPGDIDRVLERWGEALAAGVDLFDIEYRVRGADGIYRWHHVAAQPERDASGDIVRWWGSTINVDAARRLREEADAIAAEREIVLESMSEGVYALDHEWRVVYVNRSALRILNIDHLQLLGRVLWEAFPHLEGGELHQFLVDAKESGESARFTYHATLADKWLEVAATPTDGGVTVFFHDVTEVRRLSAELAQSQRLEAIGQLTGGIAHDFNNLLTVVLGGADALSADPTLTEDSREMATLITSAAERAAELTHRLLAFARKQPLEPQSVDLSAILRALEPLLRRTLGEDILIAVTPEEPALAEVDPGQFENALLNLAINARDAMPQGGTLTLEVETVTLDEAYITAHAEVSPGTYVVVTVSDSGVGIQPEHMARLFDPFFSTKEMGKGSGLGLAMVWGFIKQSGGHVTVYSEPGYGTSIKMFLPVALSEPAPVHPTRGLISTGVRTGIILLAEDDDLVRVFATERLRASGYDVVAAESGPKALAALASLPHIDLLFTDVIMPGGMTGRQLADAVLELRPGTPVLYASGYTENVIVHHDRLDAGIKLLAKPYSTKQLIERVGELTGTAEGATP